MLQFTFMTLVDSFDRIIVHSSGVRYRAYVDIFATVCKLTLKCIGYENSIVFEHTVKLRTRDRELALNTLLDSYFLKH